MKHPRSFLDMYEKCCGGTEELWLNLKSREVEDVLGPDIYGPEENMEEPLGIIKDL